MKSQSNSVIASSCRNRPQSGLGGEGVSGRATDLEVREGNFSPFCSTPNAHTSKNPGKRGSGVNFCLYRGTTLFAVKVPKYSLSVKG